MSIIMAEWKLLPEETAEQNWDNHLIKFDDCSPYQTYNWGQYQKALGWQPYYFVAEDEKGKVCAMLLGLLRRYPLGTGLMWCTGGPLGDYKNWGEKLPETILKIVNLKRLYLRFRCDRERKPETILFLDYQNWSRSVFTITSNVSMEIDLSVDENLLLSKLSRNWRRNLKAAAADNFTIKLCPNPNIEELSRVYAEMQARKNLPEQFSGEKLENLFKYSGSNLIFYRCENSSGNLLCFRGCLRIGNRACDYLAATTKLGIEQRASYPTLWQLLKHCREQGVDYYDLGGIDPWENPGVYKFKKETGARQIEYLGEWDWANKSWLRLFGNWAIWKKQKIRKVESRFVSKHSAFNRPAKISESLLEPELKNAQMSERF